MNASIMPALMTLNFTMPGMDISPLLREKFTWMNARKPSSSTPAPDTAGIPLINKPVASCDVAKFYSQVSEGKYVLVAASYCLRGDYESEWYYFAPADVATVSDEFLEFRPQIQAGLEQRLLPRTWNLRRLDKNFSGGNTQIAVSLNLPHNGRAKNQLVLRENGEASVEFKPQPVAIV